MSLLILTPSWRSVVRLLTVTTLVTPMIAACGMGYGATVKRGAFTSSVYGVGVSPRVTNHPNPPKGGGRYQVGRPYTVKGKTYIPREQPGYVDSGEASWYGSDFHGRRTANGEIFSANAITGAHPTLPLPSYVRVTNQQNGRSVVVRVNDRGPYMPGRIMDLSHRAAEMLGYVNTGHAQIRAEYVGPAPLEGDDTRMLVASYNGPPIQSSTRYADGTNSLADMAGNFFGGMFSYADSTAPQTATGSAQAAAAAIASGSPDLQASVQRFDLPLGVFGDSATALELAKHFAILGAVKEEQVTADGQPATRLSLTHLKEGVSPDDVFAMAQELGLGDIVLYE